MTRASCWNESLLSPPVDQGVEYALPAGHRERLHPAERVGHEAELCADVGAVAAEPLHGDGAGALSVAGTDAAERGIIVQLLPLNI